MDEANREASDYRARAAAWLRDNAAEYVEPRVFGDEELVCRSKEWVKRKHDAGYSAIDYPAEFGGAGGTAEQARIFAEEAAKYFLPVFTGIHIGFGMAMGTIRKHGTREQMERFGPLTHRGEITWCQMFSEPAAGSDLAALRTKATRDGDRWIVNGQKVWSSWAHHADFGVLLARHDPGVPKHKGLTMFICDLNAPGVEVRPIRQINGKSEFCEIFLTDVAIDDSLRIGAPGDGWAAAMTLLAIERNHAKGEPLDDSLDNPNSVLSMIERARSARRGHASALDDARVRAQLAQFYVEEQALKHFGGRVREAMSKGSGVPATLPVMKIINARKLQRSNAFMMDLLGYSGLFAEAHPDQKDAFQRYLWGGARRISGGAEEVMKNQLAERALGMPGEVRADKDIPFDQVPR
jgi:alkylation response protein AidB-like acyl-CoA dehydrogenase